MRILYVHPGLTPPPSDPATWEMYHMPKSIAVDVLLPTWYDNPAPLKATLGKQAFPEYRASENLTYYLYLAGRYRFGTFRQKLAVLWFHLSEGLRLRRKHHYDCVIGFNWGLASLAALLIARLLRAKFILHLANVPENTYKFNQFGESFNYSQSVTLKTRLAKFVSHRLLHLLVRFADHLYLLYPDQLKAFPDVPKVAASVLPVFCPVSRVPYTGTADGSVLAVGAPWYVKGIDILIQAFRKIEMQFPSTHLRIIGYLPPEDRAILDSLIGDSRQIDLLGSRPNPEVLRIISECSVFALSSRTDAAPRVVAEAMAAGKPVVASKVGGVPYWVKEGVNGLLFESENVDRLAACLREVLSSPELQARMGQLNYEVSRTEFTEEAWGLRMQRMIEQTVGGAVEPPAAQKDNGGSSGIGYEDSNADVRHYKRYVRTAEPRAF